MDIIQRCDVIEMVIETINRCSSMVVETINRSINREAVFFVIDGIQRYHVCERIPKVIERAYSIRRLHG